jgi:hypothetical protein
MLCRVSPRPRAARRAALLALPLLALFASACVTRTVRTVVSDDGWTKVVLRHGKKGSTVVERDFGHPIEIAEVRMAHILSRIDLRKGGDDKERVPAIPLETLFTIAAAASQGLAAANSSQEVAIQSIRRDKHFVIFERQYLTSLLCYVKDDLLYVQVSRSDWEIPRGRKEKLPETHPGEFPQDFRLVTDQGMALFDKQTVAVSWRDDIFRRATRTRVTPTGKVVRRTILMESADDDVQGGVPSDLTPAQLRALADLEEARRAGDLSETEYSAQRAAILRGAPQAPAQAD